jgi:hypothetical protein
VALSVHQQLTVCLLGACRTAADPASNLKRAIAGAAPGLRRNSMTYDERTGAMVPVPGASSKPPVPPNMSAVIRSRRSLESATPVPPSSAGEQEAV